LKKLISISFLVLFLPILSLAQAEKNMAKINKGTFVPLFGVDTNQVTIKNFLMDIYPVTNEEYLTFLKAYPKWKKSKVISLFADNNYLRNWENDTTWSKSVKSNSPVTAVSWFAAKDYCKCQGKRLPTTDEWEYVAMASATKPDARRDSLYNQSILVGYETPKTYTKQVNSGKKNYWGVYSLHGLVWEWTLDFNSVLISGESRKDVKTDRDLFCAAGSVGATDLMNYAAFMRYAFRGSIKASYSVNNLGFRCIKDIK
jgi:formylglycine-generating enzyme